MGKKLLAALVILMILASSATGAFALEQKDTSRLALDLVIALDMSSSMAKNEKQSNDMDGYRLDAAAIMLGLCDAEHSRAAIVPFAGSVLEDDFYNTKHFNKLYEINILKNTATRTSMIKELNDDEMRRRGNVDTGLGEALTRAVDILLENPSSNRPVVVLMTDGKIDFSSNKATNRAKTEASEKAFNEAVQKAYDYKIPIYTVGLKGHGGFDGELLEQTALTTGGLYHEITKASDLPEVFNSLYANEVGSNVVDLQAEMRDGENGMLTAVLNVPNRSMAEANILIPVGTKTGSAVKLYKPNQDKPVGFDGQSVIAYRTKFFTLIKILKPQEVGEWRIEFNEEDIQAADVNIHVVFSYDVVPNFEFSAAEAEKQQEFTVKVKFREPNGEYTQDEYLYLGGIQATLDLSDANGNILARQIRMNKTEEAFSYLFIPAELLKNVRKGKYYFTVTLKGDGMDLVSDPAEITIINLKPELTNEGENPFANVTIHDPTTEDYDREYSSEIDLNTYVVDRDKEVLTFEVLNAQDIDFVQTGSVKDGKITLTTRNMSGSGALRIVASDPETDKAEFEIPLSVRNIRDEIAEDYSIVVIRDEDAVEKESEYHYTAKLMNGQVWVKDTSWLDMALKSNLRVRKTYPEGKGEPKEEVLQFAAGEDGALHAKYMTELHECTYEVVGEALVRDIPVALTTADSKFTLKNNPPVPSGKGVNPLANVFIHDPTAEKYEEEYEASLDLAAFINEPDGENVTYQAEVTEGKDVVEILELNETSGQLRVKTKNTTGKAKLKATAMDEEGAPYSWDIPVSVTNVSAVIGNTWKIETKWPESMEKGQDYTCEAKVVFENKLTKGDVSAIASLIDMSGVQLKCTADPEKSEEAEMIPLVWELNEAGDGVCAAFHTKDVSAGYELVGEARIRDIGVSMASSPVTVGNIPPKVREEAAAELQRTFLIEPFLWENANENVFTLDLKSLFEDTPGDRLDFKVSEVQIDKKDAYPDDESILKAVDEGTLTATELNAIDRNTNVATLNNTVPGTRVLLITATDRDDEKVSIIHTSNIISQKSRVILLILQVVAAIVALFILFELFYWFGYRKAWSRAHGNVTMAVNGVPRAENAAFPRRGRADVTLNSLRITNAANGPGDLRNTLNSIGKAVKLRAGTKGKVKVMRTGKLNKAAKISVDGRNLTGSTKQLVWTPGGKLVITMNQSGTEITIDLKRVSEPAAAAPRKPVKSADAAGNSKGGPSI